MYENFSALRARGREQEHRKNKIARKKKKQKQKQSKKTFQWYAIFAQVLWKTNAILMYLMLKNFNRDRTSVVCIIYNTVWCCRCVKRSLAMTTSCTRLKPVAEPVAIGDLNTAAADTTTGNRTLFGNYRGRRRRLVVGRLITGGRVSKEIPLSLRRRWPRTGGARACSAFVSS